MMRLWYRCWHWLCTRIYFDRIRVIGSDRLPSRGPTLYVGLHRNGAVDGLVYVQAVPRATFLISAQLLRNAFARLFFHGIPVARTREEGDQQANWQSLNACVDLLNHGGELFVFPEGTSSLGPRHLPFRSGAARVALEAIDQGRHDLQIIPMGIHYECPWGFRSRVEVVVGKPLELVMDTALSPRNRLLTLKRHIVEGLEDVGVNVGSVEELERIERLACAATPGTKRSYFGSLKAMEPGASVPVLTAYRRLTAELEDQPVRLHQGVPLVPLGSPWLYLCLLVLLAPMIVLGAALNAPPLLASYWAGRRFPDGRNVIALWRILVGVPAGVLWATFVCVGLVLAGRPVWIGIYAALTYAFLRLLRRTHKLAVAVHNAWRCPELPRRLAEFRQLLLRHLPPEA